MVLLGIDQEPQAAVRKRLLIRAGSASPITDPHDKVPTKEESNPSTPTTYFLPTRIMTEDWENDILSDLSPSESGNEAEPEEPSSEEEESNEDDYVRSHGIGGTDPSGASHKPLNLD